MGNDTTDNETEPLSPRDRSDESISDDNLSSASLLSNLVKQTPSDTSFRKLSLDKKYDRLSIRLIGTYFEQRESVRYDDSYTKDFEEDLRRSERDRRKTLIQFYIPKYTDEYRDLKRTYSRPDLSEFHIPLMTQFNKQSQSKTSGRRSSNTTYVGKLLNTYGARGTRTRRLSTMRLMQYKQKLEEEGEEEVAPILREKSFLDEDYTPQEKKIIGEVLGDIPFRQESVYVPYGKLSYLREARFSEEEPASLFISPSTAELKLPSYDESRRTLNDLHQSPSYVTNERSLRVRSSMWDRSPSQYEFTFDPERKRSLDPPQQRKSVRFDL